VPGLGGIPVTHRGVAHEFTVVSGHVPPGDPNSLVDWEALARLPGTLVLLMAVDTLPQITAALVAAGQDPQTPAAVVQDGSMAAQRTLFSTVSDVAADLARERLRPPAIVVIGDVVGVARSLGAVSV
jgi:uroporphyrin-III C-methyltransferase/precorrin-2 dehydrogenase/sirohydrochlorin ferrochelatase